MIKVTEVMVKPVDQGNWVLAYCSVTLNEELKLKHITLVDGEKGMFITMPRRRNNSGEFVDEVFHATDRAFFKHLKSTIFDAYNYYEQTGIKRYIPAED